MLHIYFGYDTETLLSIDKYFNNIYDEEWLNDPYVREMVLDIDRSEVLDKYCIQSPVLGQIPPEKDCYIVIISRSGMFQQLPYAISSIYELRTRKDGRLSIVQMYQIYQKELIESQNNIMD